MRAKEKEKKVPVRVVVPASAAAAPVRRLFAGGSPRAGDAELAARVGWGAGSGA